MMSPKSPSPLRPSEHQFLLEYLYSVRTHYQYIELLDTGVDTRARTAAKPTGNRLFVVPNFLPHYVDPQAPQESWEEELVQLDDVLETQPRLFVLGDPGMGKTTLAQRLAFIFSKRYPKTEQAGKPSTVPFLLSLRDLDYSRLESWEDLIWAMFRLPQYRDFWLDSEQRELSEPHRQLVRALFQRGQAFVLLDGLDEVHQPHLRRKLSQLILAGIEAYPDGHWWITSRIVGFDETEFWLGKRKRGRKKGHPPQLEQSDRLEASEEESYDFFPEDFEAREHRENLPSLPGNFQKRYLAPFTLAQIRRFMGLWYDYFEPREQLQAEAVEKFSDALLGHPQVLHLARIPNLLTMMALYHQVNQRFPDGRMELYGRMVDLYLHELDRKRQLPPQHQIEPKLQSRALAAIGLEMQIRRAEQAGEAAVQLTLERSEAEDIFGERLQELDRRGDPALLQEQTRLFFEGLHIRAGIFIPRSEDSYGFLHLSYQEYFAARALREEYRQATSRRASEEEVEGFWRKLRTYAGQAAWHETIVLFFEDFQADPDAEPAECEEAFEQLFSWDKNSGAVAWDLSLAAAKVLTDEYVGQNFVPEERYRSLAFLFGEVSVGRRYEPELKAFLLSWAKPIRLYHQLPPPPVEVQWVEAEKSVQDLDCLRNCSELRVANFRETQVSELSPLANLTNLQLLELNSTQVSELSPLANLTNLQRLYLNSTPVSELSPLANLTNLNWLELNSTQVSELSPLANLTNLNWLELNSTQVSELSPLANLTNLQLLELNSTQVSELSPLENLTNLDWLDLNSTQVSELSPLQGLENLQVLQLNSTQVSELSPLANLTNLNWLFLNSTQVSELSPLQGLTRLTELYLNSTQVSELSPLANLKNLQRLQLNSTQVSELSPLANLTNLQRLQLNSTPVSELSPLANLTNLRNLSLNSTPVSELSPLQGLENLQSLDLSHTQVSDLQPLQALKSLQTLYLSHTPVSELSPLQGLENLQSLDLSHTQVSDLQPLQALKSLQTLYLSHTQVSEAQVQALREAFPECKIVWGEG